MLDQLNMLDVDGKKELPQVVKTAPKQIWLDLGFDYPEEFEDELNFFKLADVTWSEDNATDCGIEYIRADLVGLPTEVPDWPSLVGTADLPCAENTPENWSEDYTEVWKRLQVAVHNNAVLRQYAKSLRVLLASQTTQRKE